MSSESNPTGSIQNASAGNVNGDASHSRRQSAVSLPKGASNSARPGQAINFGSVHDQNAMLSSSPAVQPSSGQHLRGEKPTVFGSVTAHDSESKRTTIGFASGKGETAPSPVTGSVIGTGANPRSMDFQKLFQGTGSPAQSVSTSAGPASASTQPSQAQAASPTAGTAASPVTPATLVAQAQPPTSQMPRHPPSNLRPPTGSGHHNGPRPFEPQRSPSQHHGQGARVPSQGGPHPSFPPHPAHGHPQAGPQQPRSPHMANAAPMQPMQPMGGPWGQPQQPMGYPPQFGYHPGYGYSPVPPQHWGQQQPQGYELPGTPRSPRHASISSSPMAPNGLPPTPSMAPSTPLSTRSSNVPPSPQTAHSGIASPSHHGGPLAINQPPSGRPQGFASPSPSYAHHSPSHSFSNPMSPSARQFEPQQKRQSSAIRIVNPETQAAVDLQSIQRTPSASNQASATGTSTPSPSLSKALPAVATPAERKPVRMETPEAFMRRVQEKKKEDEAKKKAELEAAAKKTESAEAQAADESAKKEAEEKERREKEEQAKRDAEEKAAKEKEAAEAKQRAEAEEAERQKKAKEEEEAAAAAAQREAEEKAAAEKKAAEEAKAKEEADQKEREAKEAKEAAERQAKEAEEKAAKEKAEAVAAKKTADEAAAASRSKETEEEEAKPKPAPIDTQKSTQLGDDEGANTRTAADGPAAPFRGSVADVERMAREASSVPSTPLDTLPPRTPGIPQTPRTPGTPGFAGLPAKPMSSLPPSNGIKLDNEALEKKKRTVAPGNIDVASAQQHPAGDAPPSAASNALGSARFIDNINKVSYPSNIASPRAELNESAEPGKFRYDRDFLMQFMGVYTEKPQDLPPLASIGMEGGMGAGARPSGGRRGPAMGPPPPPSRAQGLGISGSANFGGKGVGIGTFSHPPKTSEERFAASSGSRGPGGMGAFGPMGSFAAGARSQPLSRTGSGSTALPSRDMMGTAIPTGGRTKSNRGRQRDPNTSRGPQVNPPEKGGPTIPLDQVVPLANSENRWVPQARASTSTVKADSPEMVQRKVKALLNKLTLEKFDSISNQILEWANRSVNENDGRTLRQVIQLIFEKATDEAAWSEMYARLCRKIMEELSMDVKDESLRTAEGKPVVGGSLFRKYLLNRCQEDFERGWAQRDTAVAAAKSKEAEDKAKKESNDKAAEEAREAEERGEKAASAPKEAELLSDEYYEAQKAKRRGLGLVRFIGELFKLSMLTERIMHLCIKKLLSNATDPEEEEVESLCKLMTTVGKLLDTEKARGHMDVYFTRMREMSQNEASINSRMRFMLLDVIELRDSHWIPRHDNSAPKTIAQIHADAARAKQQAEAEAAARQSRGGPISRGGSKRGQARGEHGPDGWSTVGGPAPPPRPSKAGDLSAFGKIERGASNRPLSFGPSNVFAKKNQAKSSEDGSHPPTRTNSQTNMFSLLNQSGDGEASAAVPEEPQRPKLNLLPRTKPVPEADKPEAKADQSGLSDEEAKRKIGNDIKEFLEIKDVNEGLAAYQELPSDRRSQFVDRIVGTALEKSKSDVENVAALLVKLSSEGVLDEATAMAGFESHMEFLDDASIDIPNIYSFMASLLVSSKLSQEKIEELGAKIAGEGIKTPKDKLLEKVAAARESSA